MVTFFDELKPRNTKHMNHLWYIVPITIAGYTRRYIMYIPTWEYVLGRYMPIYVATYTLYLPRGILIPAYYSPKYLGT